MNYTSHPYELNESDLAARLDELVEVTFEDLTSQFMLLPRGSSFVTYEQFLEGYEALRIATGGFSQFTVSCCWQALKECSTAFIVLRSILGVSPPEWQDLAKEETGMKLPANWARGIDGKVKRDREFFTASSGSTPMVVSRVESLLTAACAVLSEGAPTAPDGLIHRLDKFDTMNGIESIEYASRQHIPYAVLLYERFLGRPFASHRDSISELVGDVMESAIEAKLSEERIPFRKTKRAERVPGFEQAPDFFIPDELSPSVIIEAKITGDDGTARDKVARILRLAHMRDQRRRDGERYFQVVACVDGRGFGVRRQDIKDLIIATEGKLFTANTIKDLVTYTDLRRFAPRS
jgi:hypothetical protein